MKLARTEGVHCHFDGRHSCLSAYPLHREKATEGKPKPKGKVTAKAAKKAKEHKETSLTAEASDAATAGAVIVDGSGTT